MKLINGIAIALALTHFTPAALACGDMSQSYIGSICATANTFCPRGTLSADGWLLPIGQYSTLFSVLGTNFGGDGRTVFAVPDLRGRVPFGVNDSGEWPYVGTWRGLETNRLTYSTTPEHTHQATFAGDTVTVPALPLSVSIPTYGHTDATSTKPSAISYLTGSKDSGPTSAAIWSSEQGDIAGFWVTNHLNIKASLSSTGSAVQLTPNHQPSYIELLPPQLGLKYCVVVDGQYPPRNH